MSSTRSSSPVSTVDSEQPQLARRRTGSPEQNWMAQAAQHAAMIVQAATYWETLISTMIQDFGHRSPSQTASPTLLRVDTPIPLPMSPPQEVIYIAVPLQSDSPAYIPASPTELSHSPTPNPVAELIQTFLAEAEDNATPPTSPSAIPLPVYASPTL
jgi:hypothetical protein